MNARQQAMQHSDLHSLPLVHRGKVRDSYAVGDDQLLIVATDRLSAFDVIMPTPVPDKGQILTEISNFWFARTRHIVSNHIIDRPLEEVLQDPAELAQAQGRSVIVKRLTPLPAEAVVRGYIIGSGWKDYLGTGCVCGIRLPPDLKLAEKLQSPLFTPASKAEVGEHDENINYQQLVALVGSEYAAQMRQLSIELYVYASEYAATKGIIIADTKFEFGLDEHGKIVLMDEVLTPDSSRFWPQSTYQPGSSPPSYDKQFVRDYLETLAWNKIAPGPDIPDDILQKTADKYREARNVLLE